MTPEQRRQDVEDACATTILEGQNVTFDDIAARTGLGRATLYRNSDLRRIIEEHRARGKEAHTLSGLTNEIAHLRIALDALATTVRRHEEEIRRLRKSESERTDLLRRPKLGPD
jgi:phage portal protein BeeE